MKSGFVSIIGRPNVGKSTLLNRVVGEKIAIISNKPQTTRYTISGIYTHKKGQIVFVDTPGIHKPSNKLASMMNKDALKSTKDVDLVLFIVEPSDYIGKGDKFIINVLKEKSIPVILLINKIDVVKKENILKVIDAFSKLYDFKEIIPISAYTGENVQLVIDRIFDYLEEGPMYYPEDEITDQPVKSIVSEIVREKILYNMNDEIPHGVYVVVETFEKRPDKEIIDIRCTIVVEKDSHKGMLIGKKGQMLKKIATSSRIDIEKMLGTKVNLKTFVKVKKKWRDDVFLLKNYLFKD